MLGFIGCGNMAQAMLKGILAEGLYKPEEIIVSRRSEEELKRIRDELGVHTTTDNKEVAAKSDILVLAVKPYMFEEVIPEIRDFVGEETLVISIAAGRTISNIEHLFGKTIRLVRTMPNTPALVQEGATGMCIGVSGSSPAYVFMFIEAMADAAVADGMPRAQAYELAAKSVLGSARMILETGKHPGELKDMVCSPGGTTIEAVRVHEEKGFRSAVIEGQRACVRKAKEM